VLEPQVVVVDFLSSLWPNKSRTGTHLCLYISVCVHTFMRQMYLDRVRVFETYRTDHTVKTTCLERHCLYYILYMHLGALRTFDIYSTVCILWKCQCVCVSVCKDCCGDTPYHWFRCEFYGICVRILLPGAGSCDNCQLHH